MQDKEKEGQGGVFMIGRVGTAKARILPVPVKSIQGLSYLSVLDGRSELGK